MKRKEEILKKHLHAQYGLSINVSYIRGAGFGWVLDAMDEYARQGPDEEEDASEPVPPLAEAPTLVNHHHIPYYGGWVTWRSRQEPTAEQMIAFEKLQKVVLEMEREKK